MMLAVTLFVGGMALFAAVLGARWLDARYWTRHLVAYQLRLPNSLTADDVTRWLEIIAGMTQPPRWSLLPYPPVALEVVATRAGIRHYLVVPDGLQGKLLSVMRSGLPGARIEEASDYLASRKLATVAAELTMTGTARPLLEGRAETASNALLGSLQPLGRNETVRYQVVMTAAGTPAPVHSASPSAADASWATYLVEGEVPADADAVRAARRKQDAPLLHVVVRLGVTADSSARAKSLFSNTWGALHTLNAPGVRLVRRYLLSVVVRDRLHKWALPVLRWPLLLNSRELPGLLGLPLSGTVLPGLALSAARQLPPSPSLPHRGSVLANSNYPGMSRPLAISGVDRLRHLWYLGPTGVGKSTAIANLALQDAVAGHGFAVLDPKSDLVDDILARLPEHRLDDVVVLDPTATHQPVGFNLLGGLKGEAERELAVDHVTNVMASLWRDSWGPRSHDLLRNALLTLTHTKAPDGSDFTLAEVPELLTNPTFRRYVTGQSTVPAIVRPFWATYDQKGASGQMDMAAPLMNKLRQFFTRTSLRLMLGQSKGIDVAEVFTRKRILLVQLSKGTLGTETAQLLGALLVASLWQETLRRASVPATHRRPAFLYLDEFQDVLRLPLDIADMLAQARGLGVGMVLANQNLGQLPESVRTAVLGNVQNQVVFRLKYDDAHKLANHLSPLTADDLMGFDAHEVALQLTVGGALQRPMTGAMPPLPDIAADSPDRAEASRARFGVLRTDVEAALTARITPPAARGKAGGFGRKTAGDES